MRTMLLTVTTARSQRVQQTILLFAVALPLCVLSVTRAAPAAQQIDQSNLPEWAGGWTHVNPTGDGQAVMWQTFTPGYPNLTAVEIDVFAISPGQGDDVLTVEIAKDGAVLASAKGSVADGFSGLLRFEFPQAVPLVPEQIYELKVRDTGKTRFGWKYGLNTYERGSRYVFAQPHPGTDWFFRTYSSIEPPVAKYSGGTGEPNDPYRIATAADLIALGETPEDYDKPFILTADLDLDRNLPGRKVFDKAVIAPATVEHPSPGFSALRVTPFTGVFDGRGHQISRLTIRGETYVGLFGLLRSRAEVKNVGIVDVNVTGSASVVGGLVGQNSGTVSHCYSTGTVSGKERIGGLVGLNYGTVTDCNSTGAVTGKDFVGGLVGQNCGTLADCRSMGAVTGAGHTTGGLVGLNGGPFADGFVTNCYSTGPVKSSGESVGGLVGENWGSIAMSYSHGPVSAPKDVGGLVGVNVLSIMDSYSSGSVSGDGGVGGLVGINWGSVRSSLWDIQASGWASSDGGTGKTTAEMQTAKTFLDAGWDFVGETKNGTEDVWWILEGRDYPRLSWERMVSDDFADGKAGPLWTTYEPEPERVRLREVHGRLEVEAVAQEESVDAIYASNGWRLEVSKPFALRVDFHFVGRGTGNGRMTLGLIPSLDPAGMRWAEFEAGCFDTGPIYLYEVRDGDWVEEQVTNRSSDGGTLYMSYNPNTDELYFSTAGYGKPNAWKTVRGLLKGRWAGGPVYVILSGGSAGMALTSGDAWFDNFTISTGVIVR